MSIFTNDSFTDTTGTLLENHTGETGATWTKNPAFAGGSAAITAAGRARGNGSNGIYFESAVPASADYDVEADLYVASQVNSAGLLGRQSVSGATYYLLDYESNGVAFSLYTVVNGTTLNSLSYPMPLTVGQTYRMRLSMRGTQIICYVNGAQIMSITDANIAAAGRAGLYFGALNTDTTGFQLDNFSGAIPVPVALTDSNVFFSPYTWNSNGAGAMQATNVKAASTFAQTATPGSYLKLSVNSSTAGTVSLLMDNSGLNGITAANCPTLAISIDGHAFTSTLLAYATGTSRVLLGTNLAAGLHTIVAYFRSVNLSSALAMGDRWNTPASSLKVTGLELDGKGSALAAQTIRAKNLLVYGDSITEGANAVGSSNANADQDAVQSFAQLVAAGLNAEVGVVAYSGQGWTVSGYGNVPQFYNTGTPASSAFDKYSASVSRLIAGAFSPAPDYVLVMQGRNDAAQGATDASVSAASRGGSPRSGAMLRRRRYSSSFRPTAASAVRSPRA